MVKSKDPFIKQAIKEECKKMLILSPTAKAVKKKNLSPSFVNELTLGGEPESFSPSVSVPILILLPEHKRAFRVPLYEAAQKYFNNK
jgi:hypothetical protein